MDDDGTIKANIPAAEEVVIDGGVGKRADAVCTTTQLLGTVDVGPVKDLEAQATADGTPLLVRLGGTETFAVRHFDHRSIPGGWGHVRTVDLVGSPPAASARRRSTLSDRIQCKVIATGGGSVL